MSFVGEDSRRTRKEPGCRDLRNVAPVSDRRCWSRSKYHPVVALISTEFAGQDPFGAGPEPPKPPVQFVKRALFLGWGMARAEGLISKLATFIWDSLVLVHDETHYAEPESSGFDWTPRVQYAAARPLVFAPSDKTRFVQCTAPPLQGQVVDDSSVRLHDEGQAAADFFETRAKWTRRKRNSQGWDPSTHNQNSPGWDPGPTKRRVEDGVSKPIREEPVIPNRIEEGKEALAPRHQRRSMKQEFVGRYAISALHTGKEGQCQQQAMWAELRDMRGGAGSETPKTWKASLVSATPSTF